MLAQVTLYLTQMLGEFTLYIHTDAYSGHTVHSHRCLLRSHCTFTQMLGEFTLYIHTDTQKLHTAAQFVHTGTC